MSAKYSFSWIALSEMWLDNYRKEVVRGGGLGRKEGRKDIIANFSSFMSRFIHHVLFFYIFKFQFRWPQRLIDFISR